MTVETPVRPYRRNADPIDARELEEHRADDSEDEAADDLHRTGAAAEPRPAPAPSPRA